MTKFIMDDCIFCKIIKKEIPSDIIIEKGNFLVIKDIAPQAPIHYLLIPKKHIESMQYANQEDGQVISEMMLETKEIAKKLNIDKKGYKMIINTGIEGGQDVMHLHFHFLGGIK